MDTLNQQPASALPLKRGTAEASSAEAAASTLAAGGDSSTSEGLTPSNTDGTVGRPYFQAVARLGIQAAEALEHAHQMGIVHRDIKPSNLMVGAQGHLWVTDFGLAQVESATELTLTGDLLGTLRYMSPEQAQGNHRVLGHRSDIYSLGATLYEMLTLRPVIQERRRAHILRDILEGEPKPPRSWNRAIPRDLETIVLKALGKQPAERYATAQELADDLQRFLDDQPIRARRPSVTDRMGKWTRRHGAVLAFLVAGLLLGMLGAISAAVVATQAQQTAKQERDRALEAQQSAKRERDRALEAEQEADAQAEQARIEAARATAVVELLEEMLGSVNPEASLGMDYTVRELFDQFASGLDGKLEDQPEVEATLRHIIGRVYARLGIQDKGKAQLERALQLRQLSLGSSDIQLARTLLAYSYHLLRVGSEKCIPTALQAFAIFEEHQDGLGMLEALQTVQLYYQEFQKLAECEATSVRALELAEQLDLREHPAIPVIMSVLSTLKMQKSEVDEAVRLARQAVELHLKVNGEKHIQTAYGIHRLGRALSSKGKHEEAEACFIQALDILRLHHPESNRAIRGVPLKSLTSSLDAQRRFDQATEYLLESFRILTANLKDNPEDQQNLAAWNDSLAILLIRFDSRNERGRALDLSTEVVEFFKKRLFGPWSEVGLEECVDEMARVQLKIHEQSTQPLMSEMSLGREDERVLSSKAVQNDVLMSPENLSGQSAQLDTVWEELLSAPGAMLVTATLLADGEDVSTASRLYDCVLDTSLRQMNSDAERNLLGWDNSTFQVFRFAFLRSLRLQTSDPDGMRQEREGRVRWIRSFGEVLERCFPASSPIPQDVWDFYESLIQHDLEAKEVHLRRLTRFYPNLEARAHLLKRVGWSYARLGEFDTAIDYIERSCELNPNDGSTLWWRSEFVTPGPEDHEFFERLIQLGEEADKRGGGGHNFRLEKGYALLFIATWYREHGNDDRAEELSRQVIEIMNRLRSSDVSWAPDSWEMRTMARALNGAYAELLGILESRQKADPTNSRDAEILEVYRQWAASRDSSSSVSTHLIGYLATHDRWDEAIEILSEARERDDAIDSVVVEYWLALIQLSQGDYARYQDSCRRLLRFCDQEELPEYASFIPWVCVLGTDAIEDWDKLSEWTLRLDNQSTDTLGSLRTQGGIAYRSGRFKDAIELLKASASQEAQNTNTSPAYTAYLLAMAYQSDSQTELAHDWLQRANQGADRELQDEEILWNRRLTLELLRQEAEGLIQDVDDHDQPHESSAPLQHSE